jgi:hypothetical protein
VYTPRRLRAAEKEVRAAVFDLSIPQQRVSPATANAERAF